MDRARPISKFHAGLTEFACKIRPALENFPTLSFLQLPTPRMLKCPERRLLFVFLPDSIFPAFVKMLSTRFYEMDSSRRSRVMQKRKCF